MDSQRAIDLYGTLGGTCQSRETMLSLFRSGMTAARLNLSHAMLSDCAELLSDFRSAAAEAGVVPRLVIDLRGPELRVGELPEPLPLAEGEACLLGDGGVPVPPEVLSAARPGDRLSLDDSALLLEVRAAEGASLRCVVLRGGELRSRKSLAVLGREIDAPALTAEDYVNLSDAARYCVTDVLQPFVRGAADVKAVRAALSEAGLSHVRVMAKLENRRGLERLDEIIAAADEVCIARGDLGNAIPLWELPGVQKRIARRCRELGKPFFIATQLLWSMQERAVPTRAEVLDIYNAVLDGASGLMLTGETAAGKHPAEAMRYLSETVRAAVRENPDYF